MDRDILRGVWREFKTQSEYENFGVGDRLQQGARVRKLEPFSGPGRYFVLQYSQPCPRGCCYDGVVEIMSAQTAADEIREKIRDFADLLKEAKAKCSTT